MSLMVDSNKRTKTNHHCDSCEAGTPNSKINTAKVLKILTPISGFFLLSGFVTSFLVDMPLLGTIMYLLAILSGGVFVVVGAVRGLVTQRFLNISFLVAIASLGAIYIDQYGEAAAVVFLFSLAEFFESYGVEQSRRAVETLIKKSPKTATLLNGDTIPVENVSVGDVVTVKPGEQIPLDGVILKGHSSIDESTITGESAPVDKQTNDFLYAGTMNIQGYLEIEATKESKDSTFAQIITMIQKAQASRAPTQAFIDKFARYYTPAIVFVAVLMVVVPVVFLGQEFDIWLSRALILLVIACPCALVIATPVAVASAIGGASRVGILIKGGAYLEKLAKVKVVALDKTRTLTYGKHKVTDVFTLGGHTKEEVLADAAGIEQFSSHPLAEAILEYTEKENITPHSMESYEDTAGKGGSAHCTICEARHYIGNKKLMDKYGVRHISFIHNIEKFEKEGKTVVIVAEDIEVIGLIATSDEIRKEAADVVRVLNKQKINSVILTGDNQYSANYVAQMVGIENVFASLLPEEKVSHIQKLQKQYGVTAMVGDGVNDAPSLLTSDIGFSMGDGGTDVAIESSDVTFLSGNLNAIPQAVAIGKRTMKVIRINITMALGIKIIFLVLAPLGMTNLVFAIAADSGMAVLVILNSLRLFSVK